MTEGGLRKPGNEVLGCSVCEARCLFGSDKPPHAPSLQDRHIGRSTQRSKGGGAGAARAGGHERS
jgi:hypothetical protein